MATIKSSELNPESLTVRATLAKRTVWWVRDRSEQLIRHKRALLAFFSGLVLILSAGGFIALFALQYAPEGTWHD